MVVCILNLPVVHRSLVCRFQLPEEEVLNGGLPVSPTSFGVLVVDADGHLREITQIF